MMFYIAVIERDDGTTYEQKYKDFYDLLNLAVSLGSGYRIVDIF